MPATLSLHRSRAVRMSTGILRSSPPLLEHAQALLLGKAEVKHHGVVRLGIAEERPLLPVEGGIDRIARIPQRRYELPVEVWIVFHDEKPHYPPEALVAPQFLLRLGRSERQR